MSLDLGTLAGKISIDGADAAEKSITGVQAAMAKLAQTQDPKVAVGADTQAATQNLTGVQRLVQDLSAAKASPTVIADAAQAHADLAALEAELRDVNRTRTVAEITADAQQAMRTAEQVDDQIKALNKQKVEIPVDIDQQGTERGLRGASESVETFRDEAKANLSEVASSFQGSMDSAVDVVQGTLGGVVADLGPAGLIGGALAAAGIGLGKSLLQGTADAVNQAKQDVQDLAKTIIDADGRIDQVDWGSNIVDFGTTIVDQKSWWEVWQKDAVTNLDKVRTEAAATGQSIGTLLQGEAGGDLTGAKKTLDVLQAQSDALQLQYQMSVKVAGGVVTYDQAILDQKKSVDSAKDAVSAHVDQLEDAATAADELNAATQGLTVEQYKANQAVDEGNDALREQASLMGDTKSAQLDYEDSVAKVADGVAKYRTQQIKLYEAQEKAANGGKKLSDAQEKAAIARADADVKAGKALKDSTQAGRDNQRALLELSQDVLSYADATEKQTGSQTEANKVIEKGRKSFVDEATAAGMSKKAAEKYADQLGLVPEKVKTTFDLNTKDGQAQLQAFLREIRQARPTLLVGVKSSQSVVGVHVANGKVALYAGGGEAEGGVPGKDSVPSLLMPGEHVWTTDEVQKAGGQGAMYRARQLARQGMLRFAKGGAVPTKWKGKSLEYWQDRYASGSDYLELKQQVRDDKRDLAEKETYKDKSGHKAKRYVLRGLDRQVAAAKEREDQRALSDANTARAFVAKYGSFAAAIKARDNKKAAAQKAADKKKSDDDKAAAKKADLAQQKADATQAASRGDVVDEVTSGLSGAYSAIDQVRDLASDTNLTKAQRKALNDTANKAEKALKGLYAKSDDIAKKLDTAKATADQLASIKSETSSSLQGGFSLASALGPQQRTDKYGNVWYDKASGSSAAAAAKAYAGKVKTFATKMSALAKKLGVGSGPILQQLVGIAASDIDAGIAGEDSLLGMNAADTKTLTGAYADIAKYSDAAGQGVTEGFAKGGAAAADAFVAQLEKQQSAINAQIASWGTTLTNAMLAPFGEKLDAKGNVVKKAGGGLVVGGQAGADSVHAELMPDEFVSTTASTARNLSALAAGNAGAALVVKGTTNPAPAAATVQRVEVTLPRELVVVDTDGALIGRMKVEAGRAVVAHEAAQDRQAAYVGGGF